MIKLDGSYCEGGGSIVRTGLALSTLTQKPFEVTDVRRGRAKPGLKNQHLFCIKGLEDLCDAKTEGALLGSDYIRYWPGKIKGKTVSIDIGTAGSITLLLQSLLIPSMLCDSKVRLKIIGGTDVVWSPSFDYFNNVFLPQIRKYADIEVSLLRRGYYPKGGGKVDIKIKPKFGLNSIEEAPKIDLAEQGSLIQIKGISHASLDLQKSNVSERQAKGAKLFLSRLNVPVQIRTEYCDTLSTGSGITLWGIFSKDNGEVDISNPVLLGGSALGERGKKAEVVGREAAENLIKEVESKASVDRFLGDQLVSLVSVFGGRYKASEITDHTKTNIYVCSRLVDRKLDIEDKVIFS